MGMGYLEIEAYCASGVIPVGNANVIVKNNDGKVLYEMSTNANGITEDAELSAPPKENSQNPNNEGSCYSSYVVEISASGFDTMVIRGVKIFDTIITILPVNMIALSSEIPKITYVNQIELPENAIEGSTERHQESTFADAKVINEIVVPEFITVHLGSPDSNADNVRVPFADYIKNVASNEIFPTWSIAALESNIYCYISSALNRIYTKWYGATGKAFDITNSKEFDQFYVYGGNIFKQVSIIVDKIFNCYIKKQSREEPLLTQFCNGTTETCSGLSQWGTVTLAKQGKTPIEILKNYYPNDIEIVQCKNIGGVAELYPGYEIKVGNSGRDIQTIQKYLELIRVNYPLITQISKVDGVFGAQTENAIKVFQNTFHLKNDGIVGKSTWNKLLSVFTRVERLSKINSECEFIGIGNTPPKTVLREGSMGADVVQLQYALNFILEFYPVIPIALNNSVFDALTTNSVIAFQRLFGLTPDGVMEQKTWNRLYEIYLGIKENVKIPPNPSKMVNTEDIVNTLPEYPGYLFSVGSSGNYVQQLQKCLNNISNTHTLIPKLSEDGVFGNSTKKAVMIFQEIFGLKQNGIVGSSTWNRIMSECIEKEGGIAYPAYQGAALRIGSGGGNSPSQSSNKTISFLRLFLMVRMMGWRM